MVVIHNMWASRTPAGKWAARRSFRRGRTVQRAVGELCASCRIEIAAGGFWGAPRACGALRLYGGAAPVTPPAKTARCLEEEQSKNRARARATAPSRRWGFTRGWLVIESGPL